MTYTCKKACHWRDRLWKPGETVDVEDPKAARLPGHFAAVVAKPSEPPAAVGDALGAEKPADDDGEGTNVREALKALCLNNGIEVKPRMSMKAMRELLEAKGIKVN